MVTKKEKLKMSYEKSETSNPKSTKQKKPTIKDTEPVALGFGYSKPNQRAKK
jgi:hypothetical protein